METGQAARSRINTGQTRRSTQRAADDLFNELMSAVIDCRSLGGDCRAIRLCFGTACQALALQSLAGSRSAVAGLAERATAQLQAAIVAGTPVEVCVGDVCRTLQAALLETPNPVAEANAFTGQWTPIGLQT